MYFQFICAACGTVQTLDMDYDYKMGYIDYKCPSCSRHKEIHTDGIYPEVTYKIKEPDVVTSPWNREWHVNTCDAEQVDKPGKNKTVVSITV